MSTRTREAAAASDYYAVLDIAQTASAAEIRRAYRELARRLHPDVNRAPDAAERFATLTRAYDTLSDPARRRAYDLQRTLGSGSGPPYWAGSGVPASARRGRNGRPGIDILPPAEPSLRGLDISQTIHLTLREAAFGANKTIAVPRREVCGRCHGRGAAPGGTVRQCPRCHGTGRGQRRGEECPRCHGNGGIPSLACSGCGGRGRVESAPSFPLRFPPAVEDGEVLRIRNEGDPGPQGGPRGDLCLRIEVAPDSVLRRHGSEVFANVSLTPEQAARGGEIMVPTLHGARRLRLPRNVADGASFTMRRQGLRLKGKWLRGDQHVTIHIHIHMAEGT